MVGDQIDVFKRISLESLIEHSLIVFKPHLGKWILVNLGTSLIFHDFSIISKISINFYEFGYNIICISNHQIKLLCPLINLVV